MGNNCWFIEKLIVSKHFQQNIRLSSSGWVRSLCVYLHLSQTSVKYVKTKHTQPMINVGDDGNDNDGYDSDEVGENKYANYQKMWGSDKNSDDIGGDNVI